MNNFTIMRYVHKLLLSVYKTLQNSDVKNLFYSLIFEIYLYTLLRTKKANNNTLSFQSIYQPKISIYQSHKQNKVINFAPCKQVVDKKDKELIIKRESS